MHRRLLVCLLSSGLILVCMASPAFAQGGNIATGLLDSFVSRTDGWWGILRGYALFLFTTTLVLEVCLFGIRVALQQSNISEVIGQFVTLLLFAGFIAAVIMNYQEWATGIAVKGLKPLVGELTGGNVDAGKPVAMAAILLDRAMLVLSTAGLDDIVYVMLYEIAIFIIIIVFVLISALVIVITCEFYIVANIGVLLIGLGGSKIFKDYAVNVMRYVLSVAVKLFVLQLIVNIGFAIISMQVVASASGGATISDIRFVDLFYVIGQAIILLALSKTLPETCSGIISGSAIGGGNPLVSMGKMAGAMAMGAVTAGAGYAAGAASMAKDAHTVAKAEGASGMGMVGGMGRAMWNARKDAKVGGDQKSLEQNPGSMRNQLRSKANAAKGMRLLDDGISQDAAPGETQGGAQVSSAAALSPQAASPALAADGYEQSSSGAGANVSGGNSSQSNSRATSAPTSQNLNSESSASTASEAIKGGGSSQTAPQAAPKTADNYNQPASQAAVSRPSTTAAPVSGNTPTSPESSYPSENQKTEPMPNGTTARPNYSNSGPPPEPKKQKGTVDMRTYNPKDFK